MNSGAPWWPTYRQAAAAGTGIQRKLHRWARNEPDRRFADLFNLVCDPATCWWPGSGSRATEGAHTAGVDGLTGSTSSPGACEAVPGGSAEVSRRARSPRCRSGEVMIPKPGGKLRALGIPTVGTGWCRRPSSWSWNRSSRSISTRAPYGFRPGRRAQDAIAEIHHFTSRSYEWVWKATSRRASTRRPHGPVGRVDDGSGTSGAGAGQGVPEGRGPRQHGGLAGALTGTPQGGILHRCWPTSPCRSWTSTSPGWQEMGTVASGTTRASGLANYRLVRYADDFVVWCPGPGDAEALETRRQRCSPRSG